jgi:hypothetical protein
MSKKSEQKHMHGVMLPEPVERTATGQELDKSRTASDAELRARGTLIGQLKTPEETAELRSRFMLLDEGVPSEWTAEHVGNRLIEVARVVARMPMGGMSSKSGMWPAYQTMTKAERDQILNEHSAAGTLTQYYATLNRVRIPPSSHEIARMEEAIGWPGEYLLGEPGLAAIVTFWASEASPDDEAPGPVRIGLRMIARGLRRDGIRVK